jgi:hypothetical protein
VKSDRPPILDAPWNAEHIRRLINSLEYRALPWWTDFERAYNSYPEEHFESFSTRLFDFSMRFTGAVWELFLWQNFTDLGAKVEIEVPLTGTRAMCDFAVTLPGHQKVLVEATSRSMDKKLVMARRIEREIARTLADGIFCNHHLITASVNQHSENWPDLRRIVNDANDWIWRHEAVDSHTEPSLRINDPSGWSLDFKGHRGDSAASGFLSFTFSFMHVDDASLMRSAVETKMRKFQTDLEHPLVIAVAVNSEWWKSDVFNRFAALYARPALRVDRVTGAAVGDFTDYWKMLSDGTYSQNVSATLFGDGEFPGFSGGRQLDMWLNETAKCQIDPAKFPVATTFRRVKEDGILTLERSGNGQWAKSAFP